MILEIGDGIRDINGLKWERIDNYFTITQIDDKAGTLKAKNSFANWVYDFKINEVELVYLDKIRQMGGFIK
jgi:hypothetical protein